MNWIACICLLGAVQGVFSIFVFHRSKRSLPLRNSLFLALLVVTLLARIGYEQGLFFNPQLALLSDSLLFSYGPFLWFLFKVKEEKSSYKHLLLHLSPALIHFVSMLSLLFMNRTTYLDFLNQGQLNSYFMLISILASIHLSIYLISTFRASWSVSKTIRRFIIAGLGICLLIWTLANVEALIEGALVSNQTFQLIWIMLTLLAFFLTYQYNQGQLLFPIRTVQTGLQVDINDLEKVLKTNETFTNPELRLPEVAALLKTNTLFLSNSINQHYGFGFPDYLNKLRVEKFEALVQDTNNAHFTHWALAQQAGFKSKSAFYRAYKKERQTTPARVFKRTA